MKVITAISSIVISGVLLAGCGSPNVSSSNGSELETNELISSKEDNEAKAVLETWVSDEKNFVKAKKEEIGYLTAGEFFLTKSKLNLVAKFLGVEERIEYNADEHIYELFDLLEERIHSISSEDVRGLAEEFNNPQTYYVEIFSGTFERLIEYLDISSSENHLNKFFNLDITGLDGEEIYAESQTYHSIMGTIVEPHIEALETGLEQFGEFFPENQLSNLSLSIQSIRNSYDKQAYILENISTFQTDFTDYLEESVEEFQKAKVALAKLDAEFTQP